MQQPLVAPGFEAVAALLAQASEQDPTHRAQLSVYVHGAPVLDLAVGGVTATDLHAIFSTSKGLGSLVVARLIQDGVLDPAERVAVYWPEFAAAGKANVTVEQLLSHQAGLVGIDGGLPTQAYLDSAPAAAALAEASPWWEPGAAFGYHALTFGTLLEELVRRATGRRVQDLYEEWLRVPADAEAWLGLPVEQEVRYVPVPSAPTGDFMDPHGLFGLALNSTTGFLDADGNRVEDLLQAPNYRPVREAGLVSLGGVATARGLARVYALASTGLVATDAQAAVSPLLDADTMATVSRDRVFGEDHVTGGLKGFGIGFMRPSPVYNFGSARAFGHDGANGTLAFADPAWGVSFAYLPFTPQPGGNGSLAQRLTVEARRALAAR